MTFSEAWEQIKAANSLESYKSDLAALKDQITQAARAVKAAVEGPRTIEQINADLQVLSIDGVHAKSPLAVAVMGALEKPSEIRDFVLEYVRRGYKQETLSAGRLVSQEMAQLEALSNLKYIIGQHATPKARPAWEAAYEEAYAEVQAQLRPTATAAKTPAQAMAAPAQAGDEANVTEAATRNAKPVTPKAALAEAKRIVDETLPRPSKATMGDAYEIPALDGRDANKAVHAMGTEAGLKRLVEAGVARPLPANEGGDYDFGPTEPWRRYDVKVSTLAGSDRVLEDPTRKIAIFVRNDGRVALGTVPVDGNPYSIPSPELEIVGPLAGKLKAWVKAGEETVPLKATASTSTEARASVPDTKPVTREAPEQRTELAAPAPAAASARASAKPIAYEPERSAVVGLAGDVAPESSTKPMDIPLLPKTTAEGRQLEVGLAKYYKANTAELAGVAKAQFEKAGHTFETDAVKGAFLATNADGSYVIPEVQQTMAELARANKVDLAQPKSRALVELAFKAQYNSEMHQVANAVAKAAFADYLATLPPGKQILITSGGCASGKSYAIEKGMPSEFTAKFAAIWDAAGEQSGTENQWILDLARKQGHNPVFVYVQGDPKVAFGRALDRSLQKGRTVDATAFANSYVDGARNFVQFTSDHPDVQTILFDNRGKTPMPITANELVQYGDAVPLQRELGQMVARLTPETLNPKTVAEFTGKYGDNVNVLLSAMKTGAGKLGVIEPPGVHP